MPMSSKENEITSVVEKWTELEISTLSTLACKKDMYHVSQSPNV